MIGVEDALLSDLSADKLRFAEWNRQYPEDAIFLVERPYLPLASLLPKAKGFIFREASLLCHLAVLLREMGIPGVSSSELFQRIKDGDLVEILEDGTVKILQQQ